MSLMLPNSFLTPQQNSLCKGAAGDDVPYDGEAIVAGRHGQALVERVALQNVRAASMPLQFLQQLPTPCVPHPHAVIRQRRQDLHIIHASAHNICKVPCRMICKSDCQRH